jgi:hypothetical protein
MYTQSAQLEETPKTRQFFGLHFMVVTKGTVITDERSGKSMTVTDEASARKGRVVWCTQRTFDKLVSQVN